MDAELAGVGTVIPLDVDAEFGSGAAVTVHLDTGPRGLALQEGELFGGDALKYLIFWHEF